MSDLSRKILAEAGLILTTEIAAEGKPSTYWKSRQWHPRLYAQQAHSQDFIRHQVFQRDRGVCAKCGLDCHNLRHCLEFVKYAIDHHKLGFDFHFADFKRAVGFSRCWRFPQALWDAHMLIPKSEGGSDIDLNNFQTLCLLCHRAETNRVIYGR